MASLSETLASLLAVETAVTNIVGTRIFRLRARQGTPVPYLLISMPSHKVPSHLRGLINLQSPIVRFDMYGTNFLPLDTLRDSLITMMDQQLNAVYVFGTELYEDDTQFYHLVADFSVWHDR
jgi:hypothetical protein